MYLSEDLKAIPFGHRIFRPNSVLAYILSYQYAYLYHYLYHLRHAEYCHNCHPIFWQCRYFWHSWMMRCESRKMGGVEIPINTIGYGTIFPHIGKIIINKDASIGNGCTLYPWICIGKKDGHVPRIGDGVFVGLGAKIFGNVNIASGSIIAPNAIMTKTLSDEPAVFGGIPSRIIRKLK